MTIDRKDIKIMANKVLDKKVEIFFLMDCRNGNPNGDPDANNSPRMFRDGSNHGYITDVCIKRKIRDYVLNSVAQGRLPAEGNDIYIQPGQTLESRDVEAARSVGIVTEKDDTDTKVGIAIKAIGGTDKDIALRDAMCKRYFDIRAFGAVMTTMASTQFSRNVSGPVQVSFAESQDEVFPELVSMHRCIVTKEEKADSLSTFGSKSIIPYGLYRGTIHISPMKARATGFSEDDLKLLIQALSEMLEDDHSALRGEMCMRKLLVVTHDSMWGNAPTAKLESLLHVEKKPGVDIPHSYNDYFVSVDQDHVPAGVTIEEVI